MKVGYERIVEFMVNKKAFEEAHKKETKAHLALRLVYDSFQPQLKKLEKNYQRDILKSNVKHASEDDRGNLIVVDKAYVYSKENRFLHDEEVAELTDKLMQAQVEVKPLIISVIPPDLTYEMKKAFNGFILTLPKDKVE